MDRALRLAAKGASGASPNPYVGCVIVKNGRVLAEGYHARFGGPHAEAAALSRLRNSSTSRFRGTTLYVNLEPCSHWGKTGPCADAIIRSGVREVVAAMGDPNPLVRGKGFAKLRAAGIKVRTGVREAEARELNRPFIHFITRKKPYVFLKAAVSLDGRTATRTLDSKWITSPEARRFSHKLRTEMDAVLVGAETVRRDNPSLTSHGLGRNPVRIVVSASGRLPKNGKIFSKDTQTWIFNGNRRPKSADEDRRESGNSANGNGGNGVRWIYINPRNGKIDFNTVLSELGKRGISRLLIEGGAKTLGWALDSKQVDECLFFVAPLLIGGAKARPATEGEGFAKLKDALHFFSIETKKIGPDILIRAKR